MHFSEKFKFIMRLYNSRVRRGGATASAHTYLYIAKRAKIHDHLCVRCNLHSSTKHYSTHNNNNSIGGGGCGVGWWWWWWRWFVEHLASVGAALDHSNIAVEAAA